MNAIGLEICVDTHEGLAAAIEGGADRIELCSALDLGGLSPSLALLTAASQSPVPVYAMVRPRAGGFDFSPAEIDGMCAEIGQVRTMGLAGVVLGAGTREGLDVPALAKLSHAAHGLGRTLHRVVDLLPDRAQALEQAIELGFERILTSGGERKALDGADDIAALVSKAAGRLSIMPGAGVTPENCAEVLRRTGAREIHASARQPTIMANPRLVELGFAAQGAAVTVRDKVRAIKIAAENVKSRPEK